MNAKNNKIILGHHINKNLNQNPSLGKKKLHSNK